MLDRPQRQAAIAAMENVRSVLEWESLPETSTKFQEIAAEFDRQFAEESQQTQTADVDGDDSCNADDVLSVSEDDAMDQDDMDFIDNENDEYAGSDTTFELTEEEILSTTSEESVNEESVVVEQDESMPKSPTSSTQFADGDFLFSDMDAAQSS